jgi:hypothetical protein
MLHGRGVLQLATNPAMNGVTHRADGGTGPLDIRVAPGGGTSLPIGAPRDISGSAGSEIGVRQQASLAPSTRASPSAVWVRAGHGFIGAGEGNRTLDTQLENPETEK